MIPIAQITQWRTTAPWADDMQVEQDLILSRIIVEIFSDPFLNKELAFRGGSATKLRIKIEIDIEENFSILDRSSKEFSVNSDWFTGSAQINTFHFNELIATKLRALYQRSKGRDVFDLWLALKHKDFNVSEAIHVFLEYMKKSGKIITKDMFEKNIALKLMEHSFMDDIGPLLSIESNVPSNIGNDALILGFPLEHKNLVCHKAMISSFYTSNSVNIIQLDASVNKSNSGGPLVDISTGKVIGIVTRKSTGLTHLFDELLQSFDNNISVFSKIQGMMKLSGLDPVQALIANQHQMKRLAYEIERSANVGIGYAFSVEHIQSEIDHLKINKEEYGRQA